MKHIPCWLESKRKIYFLILKFESTVLRKFNEVILKLQGQGHIFRCAINRKWILNPQISRSRIRRKVQIKLDKQVRQMLNDCFSNISCGDASKFSIKSGNISYQLLLTFFLQKPIFFLNPFVLSATRNSELFLPCIDRFS